MSSSKTVKVQTCDLSKVLITVVCGFNLAASDNKGQCCWLEGRGGQGGVAGGAPCVQVPSTVLHNGGAEKIDGGRLHNTIRHMGMPLSLKWKWQRSV